MTDDALTAAVGIVDDDLDRIDALDRAARGRTAPAHELGQLAAETVVEGLVKAHPHHPSLARSQTEPSVKTDSDVHAPADQPSRAIRTTQAAGPSGAKRAHGVRRQFDIRHPGRIARG
ncbi:MAG: hypothetical protein QOJ29_1822, partial [Thermoleophilaceae bacterium]|nr:hypothetical protein [Thermoleophilaceae bacterium]